MEFHAEEENIARVSAVDRGSYLIRNTSGEIPAELTGNFSYRTENSADLPCVGDWVTVQYYDNESAAVINGLLPRKTVLRRKTAGVGIDFQMIAANIDVAFIIQSCHFDFNPHRLDRYLVMAADGGLDSIIILTKTDLISDEELQQKIALINATHKTRVFAVSSHTGNGLETLEAELAPGMTYCLLGSSGVGKTTLINHLVGREVYETKPVSGTGEGTHTTSRRQLIVLEKGAMLIDTPGMREVGLLAVGEGMKAGFDDLIQLAGQCRYTNCSHENEPGCAVRAAINCGTLPADRLANYIKVRKESEYYEMSYREKRKKDKNFGRFIKSVKKRIKE